MSTVYFKSKLILPKFTFDLFDFLLYNNWQYEQTWILTWTQTKTLSLTIKLGWVEWSQTRLFVTFYRIVVYKDNNFLNNLSYVYTSTKVFCNAFDTFLLFVKRKAGKPGYKKEYVC